MVTFALDVSFQAPCPESQQTLGYQARHQGRIVPEGLRYFNAYQPIQTMHSGLTFF
jgi:hypothetical protein